MSDRRVDTGAKYSPVFGKYAFLKDEQANMVLSVGDQVTVNKRADERTTRLRLASEVQRCSLGVSHKIEKNTDPMPFSLSSYSQLLWHVSSIAGRTLPNSRFLTSTRCFQEEGMIFSPSFSPRGGNKWTCFGQ